VVSSSTANGRQRIIGQDTGSERDLGWVRCARGKNELIEFVIRFLFVVLHSMYSPTKHTQHQLFRVVDLNRDFYAKRKGL